MLTLYHNPRCRKSREGLEILQNSGTDFQTRLYLAEPLTEVELRKLLKALDMRPAELLRKNEAIWKSEYAGKSLSDDDIIRAMLTYPKLIERPIVSDGNRAVVGRPGERITAFIGTL